MAEQIVRTEYSEVMQTSYIDYAMSVITARAVPDVRDGLKPVQRRVLYAMEQLGLNHDKPHRKSARIVGDAMGKYHPHGDSSIYETLVVMAQDFKKGMALVDGHGNFGSIEGDGAAAMRYTEAKLKKFTQEVYLKDLDKNVVDFVPNFDETEKEPEVLPVRVPNLLINGSEGIAVGMTTNIPTHNLGEVIDAVIAYMEKESITTEEILKLMPGPDFPTGGLVVNKKELSEIYETGAGKLKLRGKVVFEPGKKKADKDKLVITEIPYTMIGAGISKFIADVVDLVETKKTQDITDVSNESSKEGIRIVLELKRGCDIEKLKNLLYKKTRLEDTFGVNMLAIVNGRPEVLGVRQIIRHHLDFQYELARRKYTTLLEKAREQKEIKEGLIRACNIIDLIIEIIRGSQNLKQAKNCLVKGDTAGIKFRHRESELQASNLNFTENQAQAILELRLYKLIGLEIMALQKEYQELLQQIGEYEELLSSRRAMAKALKRDLLAIKKEFGYARRTVIEDGKEAVYEAPKFIEQEIIFTMDRFGYARLLDPVIFDRNRESVQNESRHVFSCLNTDKLCIFTDTGSMHQVKVSDVPVKRPKEKGTPIDNLGNYDSAGESIVFLCPMRELTGHKLLFVTRNGMVKLVDAGEFMVTKRTIAATKLADGDRVAAVMITDAKMVPVKREETGVPVMMSGGAGEEVTDYQMELDFGINTGFDSMPDEEVSATDTEMLELSSRQTLILQTEHGYFLKFALKQVPEKKKAALGVRGIKLEKDDAVSAVHLMSVGDNPVIVYREKEIALKKLKTANRDTKGTKVKGK